MACCPSHQFLNATIWSADCLTVLYLVLLRQTVGPQPRVLGSSDLGLTWLDILETHPRIGSVQTSHKHLRLREEPDLPGVSVGSGQSGPLQVRDYLAFHCVFIIGRSFLCMEAS